MKYINPNSIERCIEDLTARRAQIDALIEGLRAVLPFIGGGMPADTSAPTPNLSLSQEERVPPARKRKSKPRHCEKHPENVKFYRNGVCAACSREKARARYQETKPGPRRTPPAVKPNGHAAAVESVDPPEQKRCQSCKQMRSVDDYGMGGKRAKRRCKFCEDGAVQTKECSACHEVKPIDDFDGKSARTPLGRSDCRDCRHRANGHGDKPLVRRRRKSAALPVETEPLKREPVPDDEDPGSDLPIESETVELSTEPGEFEDTFSHIKKSADRKAAAIAEDPFEYSKPLKCMKCGVFPARYRRRKVADLSKDYWICMSGSCQVKIAHVVVNVDRSYTSSREAAQEAAS